MQVSMQKIQTIRIAVKQYKYDYKYDYKYNL